MATEIHDDSELLAPVPEDARDWDHIAELVRLYNLSLQSMAGTPKYRRGPLIGEAHKLTNSISQALGIPTSQRPSKTAVKQAAEAKDPVSGLVDFQEAVRARQRA